METEDTHRSLYHLIVWRGNMGMVEHPVFKQMTNIKWDMYAAAPANRNFIFLVSVPEVVYPRGGAASHDSDML